MGSERFNVTSPIVQSGLEAVWRLRRVNQERTRQYPSSIQAVFVLSGPGTYYQRLKPGQRNDLRWMERDRVRAGVAVMSEVTAQRVRKLKIINSKQVNVGINSIKQLGPLFVYNGTPAEVPDFKIAQASPISKLPSEKLVLMEEVEDADGTIHPIHHTGDQIRSFYQQLKRPNSPLYGIRVVAVVQHESDFGRTLHYFRKYNDDLEAAGLARLEIWPYAVSNRHDTFYPLLRAELARLEPYFQKGDLAGEAERFNT